MFACYHQMYHQTYPAQIVSRTINELVKACFKTNLLLEVVRMSSKMKT